MKTNRENWNRTAIFYFIDPFGNICLDFADKNDNHHHQLADIGNFFWERKHAELARRALLLTLEKLEI